MDETTQSGKALLSAFGAAPSFVQEFIRSGEFLAFSERLEAKLPVDDAVKAKVSNELLMTLLGITTPKDLPDNLVKEAGLPEELTSLVIEEAREGMFEPLIARGGGEPAPDLPMVLPGEGVRPSAPNPRPIPPAPQPPVPPRPTPPPAPRPQTPPPPPAVSAPAARNQSAYETFHARTMASDVEAMQPASHEPAPATVPVQTPPRAPVPAPAPAPTIGTAAAPRPAANIESDLKKYGIDPYREPIE